MIEEAIDAQISHAQNLPRLKRPNGSIVFLRFCIKGQEDGTWPKTSKDAFHSVGQWVRTRLPPWDSVQARNGTSGTAASRAVLISKGACAVTMPFPAWLEAENPAAVARVMNSIAR